MPPKKTKKSQSGAGGGVKSKKGKQVATSTNDPTEPHSTSIPYLDITCHPHILSLIIDYTPRSSIPNLLLCSKEVFKIAAPKLYKHLRVSQQHFTNLIAIGNAPAKRGTTSGILGRGFSPFLRDGLEHANTFQITDNTTYGWTMPITPRGCLSEIQAVILSRKLVYSYHQPPNHHLLPTSIMTTLERVGSDAKKITLIVEGAWLLQGEYHTLSTIAKYSKRGKKVTIVFLPGSAPNWQMLGYFYNRQGPILFVNVLQDRVNGYGADLDNIHIVGQEYYSTSGLGESPSIGADSTASGGTGVKNAPAAKHIRFIDWLDQQEPDLVFTADEEKKYRLEDKKFWDVA